MAQAKALDALAPFLALAKASNSPRQTADVVVRATSHPSTFVFAELLQTPRVQELAAADPEWAAHLQLLRIFSYGTYADYQSLQTPSSPTTQTPPLPRLNEAQARKLRQLSLITLATDHASLTYDHLAARLALDKDEALESLVVSAVYAGLVAATLDPAARLVRVSSVAPLRDVAPGSLPVLHAALRQWSQRCETTMAELDAHIASVRDGAAARAAAAQKWDATFQCAVEDEKKASLGWRPQQPSQQQQQQQPDSTSPTMKKTVTLNVGGSAMERQQPPQQQQPPVRMNKRGSNGDDDEPGDDDDSVDGGAMDLDDSSL